MFALPQDFREIDIVKRAIEIGHQHIAEEATQAYWWQVQFDLSPDTPLAPCESPAEAVFAVCFAANQLFSRGFWLRRQVDVEAPNGDKYRFDFTVVGDATPNAVDLPVAVEINGHAFHEKTLAQVTHRNRRDRALQQAGYKVFHFSYSELVRDPMACVDEVVIASLPEFQRLAPEYFAAAEMRHL